MKHITLSALAFTLFATGCASITPTYKTEEGFVIYDLRNTQTASIDRSKLLNELTESLQKNVSDVRIKRSIPPSPLPQEPGRFRITSPFAGTSAMNSPIGILANSAGGLPNVAVCDGALMVANTSNTGFAQYGEKHNFTVCVYQYAKGYSVNVYVSSSEATGGFTADTLSATISKKVIGGSSQFIPRTINDLKVTLSKYGRVEEADKFMPDSYRGIFYASRD